MLVSVIAKLTGVAIAAGAAITRLAATGVRALVPNLFFIFYPVLVR